MLRFRSLFACLILVILLSGRLFAGNQRNFDTDFLIHIRIYDEKDQKFANELKMLFSEKMDKFQKKIKQFPDIHVYIRITPNDAFYKDLIKSKPKILEFSQGFTDLRTKEIFLKNPRSIRNLDEYNELVLHEYIHLFVNYYWADAPLWFHEGMAVYFSEGISFEKYSNFMRIYTYKPMNLLKEYPTVYPDKTSLYEAYYFQAAQAVKNLVDEEPDRFYSLWDKRNMKFNDAWFTNFNTSWYVYINNFDSQIQKNFLNGIIFTLISLIWMAIPFLIIIGAIRKKLINKRIMKEWEKTQIEEEPYIYISAEEQENNPEK
jgi:hypothetical protein